MASLTDKFEEAWRSNAEDAGVATQDLEGEIILIRRMLKDDAEFFIEFFLADALDMPVPEFHKEIWGLLTDQDKERVLLAIPRDHAKTTLAKLVVIWYWLFTSHRFCVYLSNTAPIAKGACRDIMGFMETTNFVSLYGKPKMIKSSENEGLWIFELKINDRVKTCVLRGIGQGQQMRGINIDNQRPDIAVIDDVEDNENTESETQQAKLDRWMFGPFLKALARKKKILWLGNMLSKTSLLARLSRNVRWNPVVFGSLVKDAASGAMRPLWPGKWSVEGLREDFKEYKDLGLIESWMCEMMNMPGHGENGFSEDQIFYQAVPTPDEIRCAWITIDPAFGMTSQADESAISVHVIPKNPDLLPMTAEVIHGRFDEHTMFAHAYDLATRWGAWTWGIEAVAAQKVLITLFTMLLVGKRMSGRIEFIPLLAGRGDPKAGRISAFVALMANQEWAINDDDIDITSQLLEYDLRKKDQADDIIDSAAYGPFMMENFLPIIEAMSVGGADFDSRYGVQTEVEVAGV